MPEDWRYLDTRIWAQSLKVSEKYKQEDLRKHFRISSAGQAHRAGADVMVLAEVFVKLMEPDICGKKNLKEILETQASFTGMFNNVLLKPTAENDRTKPGSRGAQWRLVNSPGVESEGGAPQSGDAAEAVGSQLASSSAMGASRLTQVEAPAIGAPCLRSRWDADPLMFVEGAMKASESGEKTEEKIGDDAGGGCITLIEMRIEDSMMYPK